MQPDHATSAASAPDAPEPTALERVTGPRDPDFGRKMAALAQARGLPGFGGRRPIADRFKGTIGNVEQKIADSLEDVFDDYIAELKPADPETCPTHKRVLTCEKCGAPSQRTAYNHAAAQYLADRIMGRPTSRSESAITIKLSQQLIALFVEAFQAVNALQDATERQIAYADRVEAIEAQYTSS